MADTLSFNAKVEMVNFWVWKILCGIVHHKSRPQNMCLPHSWPQHLGTTLKDYLNNGFHQPTKKSWMFNIGMSEERSNFCSSGELVNQTLYWELPKGTFQKPGIHNYMKACFWRIKRWGPYLQTCLWEFNMGKLKFSRIIRPLVYYHNRSLHTIKRLVNLRGSR